MRLPGIYPGMGSRNWGSARVISLASAASETFSDFFKLGLDWLICKSHNNSSCSQFSFTQSQQRLSRRWAWGWQWEKAHGPGLKECSGDLWEASLSQGRQSSGQVCILNLPPLIPISHCGPLGDSCFLSELQLPPLFKKKKKKSLESRVG